MGWSYLHTISKLRWSAAAIATTSSTTYYVLWMERETWILRQVVIDVEHMFGKKGW